MPMIVRLEDHTESIRQNAKLSETAPAGKLVKAIVSTLQLPTRDDEWQPITYYLHDSAGRFKEEDTLLSRNVQPGDTLTIRPELIEEGIFRIGNDESFTDVKIQIVEERTGNNPFIQPLLTSDYPGSLPERIPLDSTAPIEQLIPAITAQLRLPMVNTQGDRITYQLRYNHRFLQPNETLAASGITDRDTLVLEHILPITSFEGFRDNGEIWGQKPQESSQKFLISYHHDDLPWANWVVTQLQENERLKCSLALFDCESVENGDDDYFENKMHESISIAKEADRIIIILSRKYLRSAFAQAQLNIAARKDPDGRKELLLPIYIENWNDELVGE